MDDRTLQGVQKGDEESGTSVAKPTQPRRELSTIKFPYDDLATSLKVARITQDRYGGHCQVDQLAEQLKQTPTSGGFRLKVAAARMFGLTQGKGQIVEVTDLGVRAISEGADGASARVEAFLHVPLYRSLYEGNRNRALPKDDQGLDALIRNLGVSAKQVTTARQAFQRSAEQAGFFGAGRDRLVMPPTGTAVEGVPTNGGAENGEDQPAGSGPVVMNHPLIVGLLGALPEPGSHFSAEDRELWLRAAEVNFALIYGRPAAPESAPAPPSPSPEPTTTVPAHRQ